MENFILWNPFFDELNHEFSFIASRMQIRMINVGTAEMIETMLKDWKLYGVAFDSWRIKPVLTNYFDEEYSSEPHWEDIWNESWEITVKLAVKQPIELICKDNLMLIRTYAKDSSYKSEMVLPPYECVIFSVFYHIDFFEMAKDFLTNIANNIYIAANKEAFIASFTKVEGYTTEDRWLVEEIYNEFENFKRYQKKDAKITIEARQMTEYQINIRLGFLEESFYVNGFIFAKILIALIKELEGTVTWNDYTDRILFNRG
ncbi:MAG: hypothetical protein EAZ55_08995 [Cytophagales bacterium]|nr:MAG: hypothetical protein EAZ55_08995 [Cytophagales bacterium]